MRYDGIDHESSLELVHQRVRPSLSSCPEISNAKDPLSKQTPADPPVSEHSDRLRRKEAVHPYCRSIPAAAATERRRCASPSAQERSRARPLVSCAVPYACVWRSAVPLRLSGIPRLPAAAASADGTPGLPASAPACARTPRSCCSAGDGEHRQKGQRSLECEGRAPTAACGFEAEHGLEQALRVDSAPEHGTRPRRRRVRRRSEQRQEKISTPKPVFPYPTQSRSSVAATQRKHSINMCPGLLPRLEEIAAFPFLAACFQPEGRPFCRRIRKQWVKGQKQPTQRA